MKREPQSKSRPLREAACPPDGTLASYAGRVFARVCEDRGVNLAAFDADQMDAVADHIARHFPKTLLPPPRTMFPRLAE